MQVGVRRFVVAMLLPLTFSSGHALAAQAAGEGFVERAVQLGLVHETFSSFDRIDGYNSKGLDDWVQSGLAIGDLDGDDRPDVVAVGGPMSNRVLLQQADGSFALSAGAGIRSGELDRVPALGDYDRDGDLDLFIGALDPGGMGPVVGRGRLYENDGSAVFTDVTGNSGTVGNGRTVHAHWTDFNLDGWLDLYTSEFHLAPNCLYRNNANGTFTEVGASAGVADDGSTHVASSIDADDNGVPDLLVGNDYVVMMLMDVPDAENEGDAHYDGLGDGSYLDVTFGSAFGQKRGIMGLAFADVDLDGDFDCYKTDVGANWLMENRGWPASGLRWLNVAKPLGVDDPSAPFHEMPGTSGPTSGWAAMFLDVDLDGFEDLFVVNGHVAGMNAEMSQLPRRQPNRLFQSLGPAGGFRFVDSTEQFGLYDEFDDRGGAMADMDGDGDLDLFVLETVGGLRYFENRVDRQGRGALTVRVETGTSAPGGIGSRAVYTASDGLPRSRVIGVDAPTASNNEFLAHFGLGDQAQVDLEVATPSGMVLSIPGVQRDSALTVVEPTLFALSTPVIRAQAQGPATLPDEVTVQAFPHDASGHPLPSSASVTLSVSGLTPTGPLAWQPDGSVTRTFQAPQQPGEHRVQASFDGWTPAVLPVIRAVGAVDAQQSLVRMDQAGVRSGSEDTVRIEVSPRDALGVGLGPGRAVSIEVPGAKPLGDVIDLGDGGYVRSFQAGLTTTTVQPPGGGPPIEVEAPTPPGQLQAQVSVDGVALAIAPTLDVAAAADGAATEVRVFEPRFTQAASPDTTKLIVTPRDASGWLLGGQAEVELTLAWDPQGGSGGGGSGGGGGGGGGGAGGGATAALAGASPSARNAVPASRHAVIPNGPFALVPGFESLPRQDGSYLFAIRRGEVTTPLDVVLVDVLIDGVVVVDDLPIDFSE